jgi:hypothetical protein
MVGGSSGRSGVHDACRMLYVDVVLTINVLICVSPCRTLVQIYYIIVDTSSGADLQQIHLVPTSIRIVWLLVYGQYGY